MPKESTTQTNILGVAGAFAAFFAEKFLLFRGIPFSASLVDHFPQQYIAALTPPGETTEFGDTDAGVVGGSHDAPANEFVGKVIGRTMENLEVSARLAAMTFSITKGVADEAWRVVRVFVPWI